MAYYEQPPMPPTYDPSKVNQPPTDMGAPFETMPADPGPSIPDAPPPSIPPAPSNSPLALPGSFAQPGTKGAAPFRTGGFLQDRLMGPQGPIRFAEGSGFGPGSSSPLGGEGGPGGGRPADDERMRALISALSRR